MLEAGFCGFMVWKVPTTQLGAAFRRGTRPGPAPPRRARPTTACTPIDIEDVIIASITRQHNESIPTRNPDPLDRIKEIAVEPDIPESEGIRF